MAAGSFAVGIGLRPFLVNINRLTAAAIAEGGLFNAEETRDSRRWRTTQILHALADREDYRWETDYQRRRFERLYPRSARGGDCAGCGGASGYRPDQQF